MVEMKKVILFINKKAIFTGFFLLMVSFCSLLSAQNPTLNQTMQNTGQNSVDITTQIKDGLFGAVGSVFGLNVGQVGLIVAGVAILLFAFKFNDFTQILQWIFYAAGAFLILKAVFNF